MSLLELFCEVDDFLLSFAPQWQASQLQAGKQRERAGQLWPSEVMTILIHFTSRTIGRLKRITPNMSRFISPANFLAW